MAEKFECYIDYLDSKNKFIETRKSFKSYDEAYKWMLGNFERIDRDLIKFY